MSEVAPPRVAGAADPSPDSLRTNPFLRPAPPPPPPPPAAPRGAAVRKRLVLDDSNPLVAAPAPAAPGPDGGAPDGSDALPAAQAPPPLAAPDSSQTGAVEAAPAGPLVLPAPAALPGMDVCNAGGRSAASPTRDAGAAGEAATPEGYRNPFSSAPRAPAARQIAGATGGDGAGRAVDAVQSGARAAPREASLQAAGGSRAAAVPGPAAAADANPFAATLPVGSGGGAGQRASTGAGGTQGLGDSPPGVAPPGALPAAARGAFSNPFAAALPPIRVPRLRPPAGGARPGSGGSGGSSGGSGSADPGSGGPRSEGPPVRAGGPGGSGVGGRQGTSAEQPVPALDSNMGSGCMRPSASAPLGGAAALLMGGRAAAPSPSRPPLAVRPRSAEAPALRASSSLPRGAVSRAALAAAAGPAGGGGARSGGRAAGNAGAGGLRTRTAAGGERGPDAAGRGGAPGSDDGPAAAKAVGAVRGWADLDQGTGAAGQDREAASAAPVMSETPLTVTFMSQARGGRVAPARTLIARSGGEQRAACAEHDAAALAASRGAAPPVPAHLAPFGVLHSTLACVSAQQTGSCRRRRGAQKDVRALFISTPAAYADSVCVRRRAQASLAASSRSSTASPFSGYMADPSEGWWVDPAQPPAAGPAPVNPAEAWWPGPVRPGPVRLVARSEPRAAAAAPGSPAAAGSGRAFGGRSASGSGGGSGELRPLSIPSSGGLDPEAGSGLGRQRSGSGFDMDAGAQCEALRGVA
jgi:hypothetical protein